MRVTFNPTARRELVEAARWYANEAGAKHAEDFTRETMRSLKLIVAYAALGSPAANGCRRMPVHRYSYSIIYRIAGENLRVLAAAHHSRSSDEHTSELQSLLRISYAVFCSHKTTQRLIGYASRSTIP